MYLLDTNVISEMRKLNTSSVAAGVQRWADRHDISMLYLSAITVMELQTGALRLQRRDPVQSATLERWLHRKVLSAFDGRILPIDLPVALRCAALHVPRTQSENDALIAATALVHGLTVVTRNVADFAPTGVPVLNPWTS